PRQSSAPPARWPARSPSAAIGSQSSEWKLNYHRWKANYQPLALAANLELPKPLIINMKPFSQPAGTRSAKPPAMVKGKNHTSFIQQAQSQSQVCAHGK